MSDEPLRELERRWATTRDAADVSRLLVERMRTRAAARPRIEIAAYLGHAPAMTALGDAAPVGEYAPWGRRRAALDEAARAPLVRLAAVVGPALRCLGPSVYRSAMSSRPKRA